MNIRDTAREILDFVTGKTVATVEVGSPLYLLTERLYKRCAFVNPSAGLPDSWEFKFLKEALCSIADGKDLCWIRPMKETDFAQVLAWLSSKPDHRANLVDKAIERYGHGKGYPGGGIRADLHQGMCLEKQIVIDEVVKVLIEEKVKQLARDAQGHLTLKNAEAYTFADLKPDAPVWVKGLFHDVGANEMWRSRFLMQALFVLEVNPNPDGDGIEPETDEELLAEYARSAALREKAFSAEGVEGLAQVQLAMKQEMLVVFKRAWDFLWSEAQHQLA